MDCPKCRVPMMVVEFEGVELDYCVRCDGTWFDRDELELLLGGLGPEALHLLPSEVGALPEAATPEARRPCPVCRKKMRKVLVGTKGDVLIDACARGDGLWFDSAEVAQLTEEIAESVPAVPGRAIHFMGRVFQAGTAPDRKEETP